MGEGALAVVWPVVGSVAAGAGGPAYRARIRCGVVLAVVAVVAGVRDSAMMMVTRLAVATEVLVAAMRAGLSTGLQASAVRPTVVTAGGVVASVERVRHRSPSGDGRSAAASAAAVSTPCCPAIRRRLLGGLPHGARGAGGHGVGGSSNKAVCRVLVVALHANASAGRAAVGNAAGVTGPFAAIWAAVGGSAAAAVRHSSTAHSQAERRGVGPVGTGLEASTAVAATRSGTARSLGTTPTRSVRAPAASSSDYASACSPAASSSTAAVGAIAGHTPAAASTLSASALVTMAIAINGLALVLFLLVVFVLLVFGFGHVASLRLAATVSRVAFSPEAACPHPSQVTWNRPARTWER